MPNIKLPPQLRLSRPSWYLFGLIGLLGSAGSAIADTALDMPLPNLPVLSPQTPSAPPPATSATSGDQVPQQTPEPAQTPELAQAEIKMAQNRIGLSDAEVAQLQAAQDKLATGDSGGALVLLQALNAQLQTETRRYVVRKSESLWDIAGQPQVYGNPNMWPLVWQANSSGLNLAYQFYDGMHLMIPAHPTLEEAAAAIKYSRSHAHQGVLLSIPRPNGR